MKKTPSSKKRKARALAKRKPSAPAVPDSTRLTQADNLPESDLLGESKFAPLIEHHQRITALGIRKPPGLIPHPTDPGAAMPQTVTGDAELDEALWLDQMSEATGTLHPEAAQHLANQVHPVVSVGGAD